jgi:hypothetical protein
MWQLNLAFRQSCHMPPPHHHAPAAHNDTHLFSLFALVAGVGVVLVGVVAVAGLRMQRCGGGRNVGGAQRRRRRRRRRPCSGSKRGVSQTCAQSGETSQDACSCTATACSKCASGRWPCQTQRSPTPDCIASHDVMIPRQRPCTVLFLFRPAGRSNRKPN